MTNIGSRGENSFVPRERGSLPRILLLDFDESYKEFLEGENYSVYAGGSGLSQTSSDIPIHESEVEIIFWDVSNLRTDGKFYVGSKIYDYSPDTAYIYSSITGALAKYSSRVREKGGFMGIFLGDTIPAPRNPLSEVLEFRFTFGKRNTTTLDLFRHEEEDDVWYEFYSRFIREENITFYMEMGYDAPSVMPYFEDEDNNIFAVSSDYFAIIPKIENNRKNNRKEEALRFLLQDVLPFFCKGEDIFPDKYYYRWANGDLYLPSEINRLKKQKAEIRTQYEEQMKETEEAIAAAMEDSLYMSRMLIADDSDLFPDDEKLSVCIHKVLEDDLGFRVTDVDEMQLALDKSLKEDKWLEDNDGFFALAEIKGTEKGAKANWVKHDLNAHIKEFEVVKGITGLNSILIFNHERRIEPENRAEPFLGDSDLIEYCEKSNICLLPVYELFKMARDVREGLLSADEARDAIKSCKGMFIHEPPEKN